MKYTINAYNTQSKATETEGCQIAKQHTTYDAPIRIIATDWDTPWEGLSDWMTRWPRTWPSAA